jgi:hypothetical protein
MHNHPKITRNEAALLLKSTEDVRMPRGSSDTPAEHRGRLKKSTFDYR